MALIQPYSLPSRMALALAALAALACTPALAAPSLEGLLTRLAPADGRFESTYVQTRESTLLSDPVRTEGRIVYESPRFLRKTERGPDGKRVIVIRDDTVEIRGPGETETQRFPVGRARMLEPLMRLLEALARGDAEALERYFDVRLDGSDSDWTLTLEDPGPRRGGNRSVHDDPLRIAVEGGTAVERIVLQPPKGQKIVLELGTGS